MEFDITASIVVYKNDPSLLDNIIKCFHNSSFRKKLFISDNSPTDSFRKSAESLNCTYIFNNQNVGFGKGHNRCMREILDSSKYHIVLNPDISFPEGTVERLYEFMEANADVGLVLPMVLNEDREVQALCKRLPTPWDLLLRRFLPTGITKGFFNRAHRKYVMLDHDYRCIFDAPSLSGCFMFFRSSALKEIGLFDERFFMYMEDIDISRRMHTRFRTVYNPQAYVIHGHARESYRINKLLFIHISSAFKYFNKWGWFFDKQRKLINQNV